MTYCEYADGVNNTTFIGTATGALTLGVGGSLDCGSTTPAQPFTAYDPVSDIWVPAGRYDVTASFFFSNYVVIP
jgi:hypothetical protein